MSVARASVFAPFSVRSFRFQWPADLFASWAFEMEVLILGWYVLVESDSVLLLVVFGALQYVGSIVSPLFGVAGDRIGYRRLFLITRSIYACLAILLGVVAALGVMNPLIVLVVAGISGMIKPSDIMMRFALIAHTLPPQQLISALGVSRVTSDSARIAGALAGVGVVASFGFVAAYVVVTLLYGISLLLALGIDRQHTSAETETPKVTSPIQVKKPTPYHDLIEAFKYVWVKPELLGAFCLAFLVNVLAYPLYLGLLPFVAKNIYEVGQAGLGVLGASYALGSLIGSIVVSLNRFTMGPARLMLVAGLIWFVVDLVFAQVTVMSVGLVLLFASGFCQSVCLTPLAGVMLRCAEPAFRGRVMGMRMLAIWGLPTGLMLSGPLIGTFGFATTATLYSVLGLLLTAAIALRWRALLWSHAAPANQNAETR